MLDFILNFFEGIYNLGPILMVPAIMFLLGLVFGMGLKSSCAQRCLPASVLLEFT